MQSDEFEWDDVKAAVNLARHGVSFETAIEACNDVFAIAREDFRHKHGEIRFVLLGMAADRILSVAYTLRAGRIRIISARLAEPQEKRRYHEENAQH